MRNDERLRTIYEVMAPYIVRNEHNWRDYLAFASQFHKHSFDNILLVYAQDEDVSILATRKQWAAIGRNLIPRAKGVAVCVYRNAKLTLDYLFDVSQTTGKEIHPTDWQLSDEMKKALTERLSYAHGFPKQDFSQALYAMVSESVAENYNHFLQELKQETKGHLFTEIPAGGFEAQYIQLLTDSISYFIGKKCHLPDEEIQLSDGMATVSHFNTLPLVAHLGTAVTALSKGILLEVERNIKIMMDKPLSYYAFEMLYWCGIREGELLALTPADFDFEAGTVKINKSYQRLHGEDVITTPKTKKSNRTIKMPNFLCDEMRDYLGMLYGVKKKDRIFTVTKSYLHHEMDRGAKEAGVKRIRIHDLRHSHISLLIDMGFSAVAIADRVGHESIEITYRYAHLFPSKQTEMADKLDFERTGA